MIPINENAISVLGEGIEEWLRGEHGRKIGFALLVFDFDEIEVGVGNYISNAVRSDMIKVLRETALRLEENADIPPAHPVVQ